MANDVVTIPELPLAVSLNGTEEVPIAVLNPGGTYTTSRTTTGAISTVAANAEYVLVGTSPLIPNARVLTGTAGDITVTDNGPGSTIVLDLGPTTGTGNIVRAQGATLGNVDITSGEITGLPAPVSPSDAATKSYVDTVAAGLSPRASVEAATVTALPANTYANGTAGVGATLTASAAGVLVVDGYVALLNDRILVQNEASGAHNGIYSITTLGTVSVPYVLTRATDYDSSAEIFAGTFTLVISGTSNAGKSFALVTTGTIVVGTTVLVFSQINTGTAYSAGNGLTLTSTIFTIDTSITVDRTTAQTLSNKTFNAPALGTPASGVATNLTGLPLTTGVTGVLPIANGGTGTSGAARVISTAGSITVTTTDSLITMNLGSVGAVAAQLPTVASRNGLPLTAADFNGNGTMTITPDVSNTGGIQGQANWVISPYGNQQFTPNAALNGWIVTA